jgi:hypothetical protein
VPVQGCTLPYLYIGSFEWRKLRNEELNGLYPHQYCSSDQTEKNEMVGHVARREETRGAYRGLVSKPEGKRPLGRPMHSLKDNIKIDLQEVG